MKKYTNQLIHSQSPYLLQHAHNPVQWHMWSDDAIEKAKAENKPILVSIGYSSCHWCHVMEHESFEDETTAAIMNEHFINIKVDREERPDIDHIYMDALQAMTGSGGWPLNVFLTSQLKPFYGGTYFPPIAAHGRMSWKETLLAVHSAYKDKNDEIELQAEKLTKYLKTSNSFTKNRREGTDDFSIETLETINENLLKNADRIWGGFGAAPKFPQTFSIQYLLRHYHFTKNQDSLKLALLSLDKMILGGIYDQIGGGFARYSTDEKWFAPHFEKMLYDNALLVSVLSEAYQITKNNLYKNVIDETLSFIQREMMSNEFAFYSALDADSEGVEGKFYVWSKKEIEHLLQNHAELFCDIFQVAENGNWEHTNILWLNTTIENIAIEKQINIDELYEKINIWKSILLKERNTRIPPQLDDKILCSWNCLMNIAFCRAYTATGNAHYKEVAEKNIQFILEKMIVSNELHHCYKNNVAYNVAYLDDYAYLIWSLIHLQEITGNADYLLKAKYFLDIVIENFGDDGNLFFHYTSHQHTNIIAQKVEVYDGAVPSANAVMSYCINYLGIVFCDDNLCKRYIEMLASLKAAIVQYPTSFGVWAMCVQNYIQSNKEISVLGNYSNADVFNICSTYIPNKIVAYQSPGSNSILPLLATKKSQYEITVYLCQNQTCFQPFNSVQNFLSFL